jgi:hypothetical protein
MRSIFDTRGESEIHYKLVDGKVGAVGKKISFYTDQSHEANTPSLYQETESDAE